MPDYLTRRTGGPRQPIRIPGLPGADTASSLTPTVILPLNVRAGELQPEPPAQFGPPPGSSAPNIYSIMNPRPLVGGIGPQGVDNAPAGYGTKPMNLPRPNPPANFYPGGTASEFSGGGDEAYEAAMSDIHRSMHWLDARSTTPLVRTEYDLIKDHADWGCLLCEAFLAGARRGVVGQKIIARQAEQAAAAARTRKRR